MTLLALFLVQPAHLNSVYLECFSHTQNRGPLQFEVSLESAKSHTAKGLSEFHGRTGSEQRAFYIR